jgi:hypothetical protein
MKKALVLIILLTGSANAQTPDYVPLDGLRCWWPFTGSANDLSGNGYHGTVYGATLTTDRFGVSNRAYYFDGGADYIWTAYYGVSGSNPRAVSFWAQTTNSVDELSAVSWGANQPGGRFGCHFNISATGVTADMAYSFITYASGGPFYDGSWHHFVFQSATSDLSEVELYMDGMLLTQSMQSANTATPINTTLVNPLTIGKVCDQSAYFFDGRIDDIGIWNRTLSVEEIGALYSGIAVEIPDPGTQSAGISVSPNPVKDQLILEVDQQQQASVAIYTTDGKLILLRELYPEELSAPVSLDLRDVPVGVYLLLFTTEKGTRQLKFVKE